MMKKYIHASYKVSEWVSLIAMIAFLIIAYPQFANALHWSISTQVVTAFSQFLPVLIITSFSFMFHILDNRIKE